MNPSNIFLFWRFTTICILLLLFLIARNTSGSRVTVFFVDLTSTQILECETIPSRPHSSLQERDPSPQVFATTIFFSTFIQPNSPQDTRTEDQPPSSPPPTPTPTPSPVTSSSSSQTSKEAVSTTPPSRPENSSSAATEVAPPNTTTHSAPQNEQPPSQSASLTSSNDSLTLTSDSSTQKQEATSQSLTDAASVSTTTATPAFSTMASPQTSAVNAPRAHTPNKDIIIGAVCAAIVLLIMALIILVWCIRRRRRHTSSNKATHFPLTHSGPNMGNFFTETGLFQGMSKKEAGQEGTRAGQGQQTQELLEQEIVELRGRLTEMEGLFHSSTRPEVLPVYSP